MMKLTVAFRNISETSNNDVYLTVHHSIDLFHLPTLMHNSLFINNMYVTLYSSTCFEHQHAHLQEEKFYYHSNWYRHSLYSRLQTVTITDAVIIQFVLLKMGMLLLETCRGL
jgi:hypothetical protein